MAKQSQVKSRRKLLNPVFHLQTKQEDDSQLTKGMVKVVRKTGQLNLSGRSLANVPERMFTMYDLDKDENNVDIDFNRTQENESWWNFTPLNYLDLSSNVLKELPGQIKIFEDLTVLNLQDNNLTTLPEEIGHLTKLTKLNLSHNKINNLPKKFFQLKELNYLSINHNCLEIINKDISDLIMLQHLDLSYNNLTKLPPGIGFLVRLTEINFSYNKLTELPPDIVNLRALINLNVTYNSLKNLPKMSELRKLQSFYAQHNDIEELPDFEGCENLQQLFIGNNYIKEITPEFCENMPHLKILELRDNKIENLPDEIATMQHLIRLDLTNNDLSTLPFSLGLIPHLQNLQIEGNKLKQIRTDILKGGTNRILKYLREKIDGDERSIPTNEQHPEVHSLFDKYVMKSSKSLNLTMKELSKIPDEVFEEAKIAEVTQVDLCKNKFTQIPAGLKIIAENICELILSHNQLKELPEYLGECNKLQYLNVTRNMLQTLPESLNNLHYLRELNISSNRFTKIPDCVYNMDSLEILLAGDNQITFIDVDNLKKLKRIAVLDLSNNNIDHCPPELGNIKQLRNLQLQGNSFRQPRYAILEQGTESILSYLRDRIPK